MNKARNYSELEAHNTGDIAIEANESNADNDTLVQYNIAESSSASTTMAGVNSTHMLTSTQEKRQQRRMDYSKAVRDNLKRRRKKLG